jgi:DNA-binding response OmpR family regulator
MQKSPKISSGARKILIVEDDNLIADMYASKFRRAGYEIDLAKDGQEAITKVKNNKPDLVVSDVVLPNKDGFEILRAIKNDPELKSIKVIMLTNLGEPENIKKGLESRADANLIKAHSTPSQIVEKIEEILNETNGSR